MVAGTMDPVFLSMSRLRRRKYDACIEKCTELLERNQYDQAVWYLKARALTLQSYIDDTEVEEEGLADVLMDENALNSMPRPGTSLNRPKTSSVGQVNQGVRPMTQSGRPVTGFVRPGTQGRPVSGAPGAPATASQRLSTAYRNARPGTTRPVTASGRFVRLGTASMLTQPGGMFIDVERLNLAKYASRPHLSRALCDYILYHERNPRKAVELAAHATKFLDYEDWWWKARLGKGYYQLGLLREAEQQFLSSIRSLSVTTPIMELCKCYVRMDQPNTAIEHFERGLAAHPSDTDLQLGIGRLHDALNSLDRGVEVYRRVLYWDASNVEAIACLGAHSFYSDQPEIALRFYRRLLQMGVSSTELWNNLALCCFHAGQYDMTIICFEKALQLAGDAEGADIWYNIGQLALGIGDLGLAFQAFKIAVSLDSQHGESFANLGVLEMRRGNEEAAINNIRAATTVNPSLFEPVYNLALLLYRTGDFQEAYRQVNKALEIYPDHTESKELQRTIRQAFTSV
ncbi:unnamed protein product [Pedinophyceae sp. YPF-701]|nr:unnamed protein product [Pedinophyceae sp. YPF-701]